ncbi:hypothetical protein [Rubritalea sp.]|uniref:hypothetical protein n=1 Tax=Rubritalea sp. TaxID=2109375 RepID=UPI003EF8C199
MQYFYDLALLDARGELSTALTVLHYGSEIGAFSGSEKKKHDLEKIHSLEIDLTDYAANHDGLHSYSLMFFERGWNKQVWEMKLFQHKRNLKAITTRVKLSAKILDNPPHDHHLFTSSNRYIDFSEYPELAAAPNVPQSYIQQFNTRFVGYLMRSERNFDDVREMFTSCELKNILDAKFDTSENYHHIHMAAYGKAG